MEARYIDANRLIEVFDRNFTPGMVDVLKQYVDMQPTADVLPVVRGEWTFVDEDPEMGENGVECRKCSKCGYEFVEEVGKFPKFCPNCFAKNEV
jgi:predicted Zn-ribbon and HTH transcriptional regulator